MSTWTHVVGSIRIDGVKEKKLLGIEDNNYKQWLTSPDVSYEIYQRKVVFNFDRANEKFIENLNSELHCGCEGPAELSYCKAMMTRKIWHSDGSMSTGCSCFKITDNKLEYDDDESGKFVWVDEYGSRFAINVFGDLRDCESNEFLAELIDLLKKMLDVYCIEDIFIKIDDDFGCTKIIKSIDFDFDENRKVKYSITVEDENGIKEIDL